MQLTTHILTVLIGAVACTVPLADARGKCVTPEDITAAAKAAKDEWNKASTVAKNSGEFVLNVVKDLLEDDSSDGVKNLTAAKVEDQFKALHDNRAAWQEVLIEGATAGDLTTNASKVCRRVQQWANDGEIVVAIWAPSGGDPMRISIVVPDKALPATKATSGPWKDVLVPRVAFANDVAAGTSGVSLEIKDLVATLKNGSEPKDMHFFRYRF